MKKISAFFMSGLIASSLMICSSQTTSARNGNAEMPEPETIQVRDDASSEGSPNILIAYFTMPENVDTTGVDAVSSASIVVKDNEKMGSMEYVAKLIQETVGGDLFRIETVQEYPLDHAPLVEQAREEQDADARPELSTYVDDFDSYDYIFLGYPIWWSDMPQPLYTFLEEYDFEGKTVIPFVTHGGSSLAGTVGRISQMLPGATVNSNALCISRNVVANSSDDVIAWAKSFELEDKGEGPGDEVAVTGVTLNKTEIVLTEEGATEQLIAEVSPADAGNKEVEWSSSNISVATVDDSGLVTAKSNGTCQIIATTKDGNKKAACLVTVEIPKQAEPEKPVPESGRVAGLNRYQTAIACAKLLQQKETFSAVVIASADNFPDALAGSVLAASLDAPILLAGKSADDTEETLTFININLEKNGQVYILGGGDAVPTSVENTLERYNFVNVKRLCGTSRYATNLEIIEEMSVEKGTDIVIASGTDYADSLSVSGIAGAGNMPVFLVGNKLTEEAEKKIREIEPSHIYIIGGTSAVNNETERQLQALGGSVIRISGATRYETSLAAAEYFGMDQADSAVFAYGGNFPDGLTGGVLAAYLNAPVILVSNDNYEAQEEFLNRSSIVNTYVMGGSGVISDETLEHLMR